MGSSGSCSMKRAGHMVGAVDTSCRVGRTFGRRIEFPARTAGAPWLTQPRHGAPSATSRITRRPKPRVLGLRLGLEARVG